MIQTCWSNLNAFSMHSDATSPNPNPHASHPPAGKTTVQAWGARPRVVGCRPRHPECRGSQETQRSAQGRGGAWPMGETCATEQRLRLELGIVGCVFSTRDPIMAMRPKDRKQQTPNCESSSLVDRHRARTLKTITSVPLIGRSRTQTCESVAGATARLPTKSPRRSTAVCRATPQATRTVPASSRHSASWSNQPRHAQRRPWIAS